MMITTTSSRMMRMKVPPIAPPIMVAETGVVVASGGKVVGMINVIVTLVGCICITAYL